LLRIAVISLGTVAAVAAIHRLKVRADARALLQRIPMGVFASVVHVVFGEVVAALATWIHFGNVRSHSVKVPSKYLKVTMSSRYLKHVQQTIASISFSLPQPRQKVSVRACFSKGSNAIMITQLF